ncbi:MAG: hypothetical protein ABJF01_20510 [bacterium]
MTNRDTEEVKESKTKARLPAALIFGIIAATIEIGFVLWMMYR